MEAYIGNEKFKKFLGVLDINVYVFDVIFLAPGILTAANHGKTCKFIKDMRSLC